ncbi:helix-turn-helix domain-containing protein [Planosporangium sp. 12N6]|uniref:helix-turn-helix domain-containing protein n=1 Tax=Planosporangium spinosum TaxID=3402278 RepID=UPI003CF6E6CE
MAESGPPIARGAYDLCTVVIDSHGDLVQPDRLPTSGTIDGGRAVIVTPTGAAHYCSCGTRLASDNRTGRCGACRKKDRQRFQRPPLVPPEFWDHAEIRHALASCHFGRVIRAYWCHSFHGIQPLAQEVVAGWLGVTQSQLSRIENGAPVRDLDRLIAWAKLLGVPEQLLWFRLPTSHSRTSVHPAPPPRATLPFPPVAAALPNPLRGSVAVDDLAAMHSLRTSDRQVGGGHLYATVASYLQTRIAPRLFGENTDSDEHRVFAAAASFTEMAGWMAHDAGRDTLAEQHFRRALGMTSLGQDHQLGAHVLASLAHLANHQKRPQRAIAYAQDGHARLATGRPHPGVEAQLLAMQARGHAGMRDHDRCEEQLRRAERTLACSSTDVSSPWVSTFDEASLATEAARCFRQLGRLGAARQQAEQVVSLRSMDRTRSRAFAQLMLASILIAEGKPDEACALAHGTLDATRSLGSHLVLRQFEQLHRLLRPYRRSREIAGFLSQLTVELHERRWVSRWLPTTEPAVPPGTGTP